MRRVATGMLIGVLVAGTAAATKYGSPTKWEYNFFSLTKKNWQAQVDSLGREGWELVSYVDSGQRSPMGGLAEPILLVFKRPLP